MTAFEQSLQNQALERAASVLEREAEAQRELATRARDNDLEYLAEQLERDIDAWECAVRCVRSLIQYPQVIA